MKLYASSKLRVWENLSLTLREFKVKLLGYRSYVASIRQTGTDPIEILNVFENTLDLKITDSIYDGAGEYAITFNKTFDVDTVYVTLSSTSGNSADPISFQMYSTDMTIYSLSEGSGADDVIGNANAITILEIRVYNQ